METPLDREAICALLGRENHVQPLRDALPMFYEEIAV
ncbi:hypothetical protein RS9917_11585 [Synechococcus sp. RS9917]|nr:hypothetical protein RS9917_11585 [Synechococcus sp. RS9917]